MLTIILFIASILLSILGYLIKTILDKLNSIDEELNAHIVLDTKVQTEMQVNIKNMSSDIEEKLDKIIEELK